MVKESVVRWLRSRDHINEAIARLAYICCLGRDYHRIHPDMAKIEVVIAERHEGDVRHRPTAVEWT